MPTIEELTAGPSNFMLRPRHGPGVCRRCFNLTDGYSRCYSCAHGEQWLDAVAPISYSVAHEQLHHMLASYKRLTGQAAVRTSLALAAILWRHLSGHECCLARACGVRRFDVVATVPAGTVVRDGDQPLRHLVTRWVEPVAGRHRQLLFRTREPVPAREFDSRRFVAGQALSGEAVLLIDDTWTTGASAQSAAAALKGAGAGPVGVLVIGRHVNRDWRGNDKVLRALPTPFDWSRCVLCDEAGVEAVAAHDGDAPEAAARPTSSPAARTP